MTLTMEQLDDKLKEQLDLMLTLKMRDFRAHDMKNITRQNVIDYLFQVKWKRRDRIMTCDIVNDVLEVSASQIFEHMRRQSIKQAASLDLNDFSDLISK